jgi:hypothetical protein
MTCSDCSSINKIGLEPTNVQWTLVRGDSSQLRVDFLNYDETTIWNISTWTFVSTAYDPINESYEELTVTKYSGYVIISASADITSTWGLNYASVMAEIPFDLKVTIPSTSTTWTPVVGTICVIGDVTTGGSL